jgi:hypothetical protein
VDRGSGTGGGAIFSVVFDLLSPTSLKLATGLALGEDPAVESAPLLEGDPCGF